MPAEPVGTVDVALAHAERLLATNPELAGRQAAEILAAVPGYPPALLVAARARRAEGRLDESLEMLAELARAQPNWAAAHLELGLTLGLAGRGGEAIAVLQRAVELKPDLPDAWRVLGDHLMAAGDREAAEAAYARHVRHSIRDPRLLAPATALSENRIAEAEHLLKDHLKRFPTDVAAIRMLAEVAGRLGRYGDAEKLLERCLELAPTFSAARHNMALVLHRQNRPAEALAHLERILAEEPRNAAYRNLKGAILVRIGEYAEALDLYAGVLEEYPNQPKLWMSYGHALKTAGRQDDSINSYRRCIGLAPNLGEAWWSLANLKTLRFTDEDVAAMKAQLERTDLTVEDRFHFHFALGKALEDRQEYEDSFHHYAEGNRLRHETIRWDADENSAHVRRSRALFTEEFFQARADQGCSAPDPIFVVGLPRSGSTLVEQILSSHSAVEGTMELPNLLTIARQLGEKKRRSDVSKYPEVLADLDASELRALGERYLEETRIQRKTSAPFFVDKMPNNFQHVGLIHLILPNARIIDTRRHPLGCCFSVFKQHFARGQNFSYSLEDIGRYYRDYVELMAHFDAVLPGRVHRVYYEAMVENTEDEVRRLLDYCGLPFEDGCLQFYNNPRAVRTASSEQVRTPIYREGMEQWLRYDPWLGPLKDVLGEVLDRYPDTPAF